MSKAEKEMVSVIIPVYKTEEYLEECIESVLRQDYPELEILLVDDGSPDTCPVICDRYGEEYTNIRVIHKENQGVGAARNKGAQLCRGTYVMFLDSDDMLDEADAVSTLVKCAGEKQADIVVGGFRRLGDEGVSEVNPPRLFGGDCTNTVDFRFKGFFMYGHLAYMWGKLYRKEFLEKHCLKSGDAPFMQDKLYNMECCAYRPVYEFLDKSVVLYRMNEQSVTFKYKKDLPRLWQGIVREFQGFLRERQIEEDYGDLTAFHIFFGSFFLVKQELQEKNQGLRGAVQKLKEYGACSAVQKAMGALAGGEYVRSIKPLSWRIVIRAAAVLFRIRAYWLYAAGIGLLRRLQVDRSITRRRYKKQRKNT